jgi:hypothetical protein
MVSGENFVYKKILKLPPFLRNVDKGALLSIKLNLYLRNTASESNSDIPH